MNRDAKFRALGCVGLFLVGLLFLGVRTVQLHLHPDQRVTHRKERQIRNQITVAPQRGVIFDVSGNVLAMSLQVPSVFADPSIINDPKTFAKKVAPLLKISKRKIQSKIKNRNRRFVWLKRKIDPAIEGQLKELKLEGLYITREGDRIYPQGKLASQVVGFAGMDGYGLEGIELHYDHILRSRSKRFRVEKDGRGRAIFTAENAPFSDSVGDLYLTIDSAIQHVVESKLSQAFQASGAKSAMALIMDPATGAIKAMATYPSYDPNRPSRASSAKFRNLPVQRVFEPGSTFKVFALAAALEEGMIEPSAQILCKKGSLTLNRKTISTQIENDWLTPGEILKFSDNIGISRIALKTGRRKLYRHIRNFGFGERTGLDFPAEAKGLLKAPDRWRDIDLSNISFGQGVGVTAVQMVTALSAVANGGYLVRPHVVDRIKPENGPERVVHPVTRTRRIFGKETAQLLRDWMATVTEKDGTGHRAAIPGYQTAGKTGTAQKIDPESRSYSHQKVASSFFGFAPASDPKLAALIFFDEPEEPLGGGVLAAPVFREIMQASFHYMGVKPDALAPQTVSLEPERNEESVPSDQVEREAIRFQNVGSESDVRVPDFRGLTMREALAAVKDLRNPIRVTGTGFVYKQMPAPGETFLEGDVLWIYLSKKPLNREQEAS